MGWQAFKQRYHRELNNPANHGYELKFVDLVLQHIPNLSPSEVIPQYRFKDKTGKNRFVDFMIISHDKNWLLPIELDGYTKMVGNGEEYHRFNDFLERQNAMIAIFGLVLRYSNKTMINQSAKVIAEITEVLQRQSQAKSTQQIQEKHTQQIITDYEQKVQELQAQNQQTKQLTSTIQQIQSELQQLKTLQQSEYIDDDYDEQTTSSKLPWFIGITAVLLIGLVGGGYWFFTKQPTHPQIITKVETVEVIKEVPAPIPTPTPVSEPEPIKAETKETPKKVTEKVEAPKPEPVIKENITVKQVETPPKPEPKQEVTNICGVVAQVKEFKEGTYLNLGSPYPNQTMTLVVWRQQDLDYLLNQEVCTYGNVDMYKGKPRINVNSLKGLRVK